MDPNKAPPHVATLPPWERPGAAPPHAATLAQRRAAPLDVSKALPPHPATVLQQRSAGGRLGNALSLQRSAAASSSGKGSSSAAAVASAASSAAAASASPEVKEWALLSSTQKQRALVKLEELKKAVLANEHARADIAKIFAKCADFETALRLSIGFKLTQTVVVEATKAFDIPSDSAIYSKGHEDDAAALTAGYTIGSFGIDGGCAQASWILLQWLQWLTRTFAPKKIADDVVARLVGAGDNGHTWLVVLSHGQRKVIDPTWRQYLVTDDIRPSLAKGVMDDAFREIREMPMIVMVTEERHQAYLANARNIE